jgi:hypothetical protein
LRRSTCAKIEKGYLQIQQGYQDEGGRKGPMRRKSTARHGLLLRRGASLGTDCRYLPPFAGADFA